MCVCVCVCGAFNKFQNIFVQAFRIVLNSCMLLLYILWDDWEFLWF